MKSIRPHDDKEIDEVMEDLDDLNTLNDDEISPLKAHASAPKEVNASAPNIKQDGPSLLPESYPNEIVDL